MKFDLSYSKLIYAGKKLPTAKINRCRTVAVVSKTVAVKVNNFFAVVK